MSHLGWCAAEAIHVARISLVHDLRAREATVAGRVTAADAAILAYARASGQAAGYMFRAVEMAYDAGVRDASRRARR